jgi:hypothetical protein
MTVIGHLEVLRASVKFNAWRHRRKFSDEELLKLNLKEEKHWSVNDVAKQWGVSPDLIRDVFKDEDGVLIFERPRTRTKRAYSTMKIPDSVLERVYNELSKR